MSVHVEYGDVRYVGMDLQVGAPGDDEVVEIEPKEVAFVIGLGGDTVFAVYGERDQLLEFLRTTLPARAAEMLAELEAS